MVLLCRQWLMVINVFFQGQFVDIITAVLRMEWVLRRCCISRSRCVSHWKQVRSIDNDVLQRVRPKTNFVSNFPCFLFWCSSENLHQFVFDWNSFGNIYVRCMNSSCNGCLVAIDIAMVNTTPAFLETTKQGRAIKTEKQLGDACSTVFQNGWRTHDQLCFDKLLK